jgi:hypothetical protein
VDRTARFKRKLSHTAARGLGLLSRGSNVRSLPGAACPFSRRGMRGTLVYDTFELGTSACPTLPMTFRNRDANPNGLSVRRRDLAGPLE